MPGNFETIRHPIMSDFRENIEQHADLVLFLSRDEACNPDAVNNSRIKISIVKNHDELIGTVYHD